MAVLIDGKIRGLPKVCKAAQSAGSVPGVAVQRPESLQTPSSLATSAPAASPCVRTGRKEKSGSEARATGAHSAARLREWATGRDLASEYEGGGCGAASGPLRAVVVGRRRFVWPSPAASSLALPPLPLPAAVPAPNRTFESVASTGHGDGLGASGRSNCASASRPAAGALQRVQLRAGGARVRAGGHPVELRRLPLPDQHPLHRAHRGSPPRHPRPPRRAGAAAAAAAAALSPRRGLYGCDRHFFGPLGPGFGPRRPASFGFAATRSRLHRLQTRGPRPRA